MELIILFNYYSYYVELELELELSWKKKKGLKIASEH
jgi:hypothetical protein